MAVWKALTTLVDALKAHAVGQLDNLPHVDHVFNCDAEKSGVGALNILLHFPNAKIESQLPETLFFAAAALNKLGLAVDAVESTRTSTEVA